MPAHEMLRRGTELLRCAAAAGGAPGGAGREGAGRSGAGRRGRRGARKLAGPRPHAGTSSATARWSRSIARQRLEARWGSAWVVHDRARSAVSRRRRIVVDGVMYTTGSPGVSCYALDPATGREIWRYDPKVPRWPGGATPAAMSVNRGVAVWKGRVYVGTIDGRLLALDAKTGGPVWDVQHDRPVAPYTITGAPRVVKGKVIHRQRRRRVRRARLLQRLRRRGDGPRLWRFYTVPGESSGSARASRSSKLAAKTWTGTRLVGVGARRHGLGFHGLRPGARPALRRRRQRLRVQPSSCAAPAAATTSSCPRSSLCARDG